MHALTRPLRVASAFNRSAFVAELYPSQDCTGASSMISPGRVAGYSPPFPVGSVEARHA